MDEAGARKRRHRRVALTLPVRLISIDPETDRHTGRVCFRASREVCGNVSHGGAYIRTGEPLSPGRRVLLELQLPGGRWFETMGKVAWSRTELSPRGSVESGAGVEFIGSNGSELETLGQFLDRSSR